MSNHCDYDIVRYPSLVHAQLHPARLAAIAALHGVPAASPSTCNLLEVGCGDGLQLLALAQAYPRATFTGIDLSATAIARGERLRAALGLGNLRLVAGDLLDWEPTTGPCDFIVAHGFYSWVPEPVRDRLLALCGSHLAPGGIACISYNTLPGGHLRRMLWDIMRFHAGDASDPGARVARALECLDLLEAGMPEGERYTRVMAEEISALRGRLDPGVLFHDDLAATNEPCTLDRFVRHARGNGLEFLAEASYHEMSLQRVGDGARQLLEEIGRDDPVTKEQYLDFMKGRRFRQTLLCRAEARPRPAADAAVVAGLHLSTRLRPRQDAGTDAGMRDYDHPSSGTLATADPVLKGMLDACADANSHPLPVQALLDAARAAVPDAATRGQDLARVCDALLRAYAAGLVDLLLDPAPFARLVPERPVASPLARATAADGQRLVPSLRLHMVEIAGTASLALLAALDGSRDRAALQAQVARECGTADAGTIEMALRGFVEMALLCADDDIDGPGPAC